MKGKDKPDSPAVYLELMFQEKHTAKERGVRRKIKYFAGVTGKSNFAMHFESERLLHMSCSDLSKETT